MKRVEHGALSVTLGSILENKAKESQASISLKEIVQELESGKYGQPKGADYGGVDRRKHPRFTAQQAIEATRHLRRSDS